MREWLAVCAAEQVTPLQLTALTPTLLPFVLRLPDWLFRRVAAKMLRIDPQARLSMSADLSSGRRTEIAFLNGAVVQLAKQHGIKTPVNQAIVDLVHQKQQDPAYTAEPLQLCRQLQLC